MYLNSCLEILTENKSYCSFGGGGGEKYFFGGGAGGGDGLSKFAGFGEEPSFKSLRLSVEEPDDQNFHFMTLLQF